MKSIILFSIICLLHVHPSSQSDFFECKSSSGNVPDLPKSFSTDIKMNFIQQESTIEMKYAKMSKLQNELIEFKSKDRHVKYIVRGDEGSTLYIEYKENEQPKCEVTKSTDKKDFLKKQDSGDDHLILKALEVMLDPFEYRIYSTGPYLDTGMFAIRYEGCLSDPKMNFSIAFAAKEWTMSHGTASLDVNYPEVVAAEIENNKMKAFYSNFDPTEPKISLFQPPPDVFCKGFSTKKTPPKMPNYFSYSAELINYDRVNNRIVPLLSQRKVYYDYKDKIARIDFNDLLAADNNSSSKTTAQKKSIIHDYNSGVQYIIESSTGKCSVDAFRETFNAISYEPTKDNKMITGAEFFWLDNADTSYNGQFPRRGVMTDVYTTLRIDPKTKNSNIITWFFSADATQVAENENVEKNVLLSMYIRPETELAKEKVTHIHFFDFVSEEPDIFNFDLTKCFNESSSKTLVFTFPAHNSLRGSEKLIGRILNIAIQDITGVRKHRISTKEVIFSGKYMYAEFILLEDSPTGSSEGKISLEDALQKLQNSVSSGKFKVNVQTETNVILLKPEPNGLNAFAGDRPRASGDKGYKEGSVIALTIGMLILGFLLGIVTINLIMSRKYGVSLFQKSRFGGGSKGTQSPLTEISM